MLHDLLHAIGAHLAQISSVLQVIVGLWLAVVAARALKTWSKQLRAQQQLSFIDDLTDTIHEYILALSAPTERLRFAKIGIDVHEGITPGLESYQNPGAIAFIEKYGQETSAKIMEDLALVRPLLSKMQSLSA